MIHIHPSLSTKVSFMPFRILVLWDGVPIGVVYSYLAAEQLGRAYLASLLEAQP